MPRSASLTSRRSEHVPYCTSCGNDVTGRKFCTSCGQQVKQRTPPPPEPTPTSWWSHQHDRSWWIKQIAGIGAVVLVIAAAAYGVTWFNSRNDTTPNIATGADPTTVPEAPRVCWDKSELEGTEQCPMPHGLDGIAALSPAIKDAYWGKRCHETIDVRDVDSHTCEIAIPGHGQQSVIIDSFESVDEVDREAVYYEACEAVPSTEVEVCHGKEYNDQNALRFADRKLHYLVVIDKEAGGTDALKALTWTPLNAVLNP